MKVASTLFVFALTLALAVGCGKKNTTPTGGLTDAQRREQQLQQQAAQNPHVPIQAVSPYAKIFPENTGSLLPTRQRVWSNAAISGQARTEIMRQLPTDSFRIPREHFNKFMEKTCVELVYVRVPATRHLLDRSGYFLEFQNKACPTANSDRPQADEGSIMFVLQDKSSNWDYSTETARPTFAWNKTPELNNPRFADDREMAKYRWNVTSEGVNQLTITELCKELRPAQPAQPAAGGRPAIPAIAAVKTCNVHLNANGWQKLEPTAVPVPAILPMPPARP